MAEILNAHGSKNDIFVAAMTPREFASDEDLRAFVRRLCDRAGPFGGDGIYFYDADPRVPEAWFFNPDGSSAEFCGNGMRCLGRVVLDRRGADAAVIRSGQAEYTVRRGATTGEGVRQVSLEQPAVDFTPPAPVVAGRNPLTQARPPELDPGREVVVRNAGGMATVSLQVRQDRWHPVLEGNATFVYRAEVDPAVLAADAVEPCNDEVRAYAALDERNTARLHEAGVTG